jgi:hypothetical protein
VTTNQPITFGVHTSYITSSVVFALNYVSEGEINETEIILNSLCMHEQSLRGAVSILNNLVDRLFFLRFASFHKIFCLKQSHATVNNSSCTVTTNVCELCFFIYTSVQLKL